MIGNSAYDRMMRDICVGHGWCGGVVDGKPSHVDHFIPQTGAVSADQFIDWLFEAEGYNPSDRPDDTAKFRSDLRKLFLEHMGAEPVDASLLKWAI